MNFLNYFSASYADAQEKFLAAVKDVGAAVESHHHPLPGPTGEQLTMHVARLGTMAADKVLVLSAGTHGAEGLCGSGCMVGWLREGHHKTLSPDMAVVLIHFVNPYGVAWRCRQTEDNVDLNRNFVNHRDQDYPQNTGYDALHDALLALPSDKAAAAVLQNFAEANGRRAFNAAILTGQYHHPDGLFFGGKAPVWSNTMILDVLRRHCASARDVAHIDYHTGLGPYGYGMLVNADDVGTEALGRAQAWYGETLCAIRASQPGAEADDGPVAVGDMCSGIRAALPHAIYSYIALEYGTYDIERFINVYRADCRLKKHGADTKDQDQMVRSDFQNFFYPPYDDWKEMIWWRSEQVVRQAIHGLSTC